MDPIHNPYVPGAGNPPHELAGRDSVREQIRIAIARIRIGRAAKSLLMIGLRGVGKTVLLDQMRSDAESQGVVTVRIEASEGRSLPSLLAPALRVALLRLSRTAAIKDRANRALRTLVSFAKALKLKYSDIEVAIDVEPLQGSADNGDLDTDLGELFVELGGTAKEAGTAVVIFLDEMQYLAEEQFAALISALHRCAQLQLPLTLVGAGLPQLRGRAGDAKSYAERLFDFPEIGPLSHEEATLAIVKPARNEGVEFEPAALESILAQTCGYPYFLQEWGNHAWDVARQSPISLSDVKRATQETIAALDQSFFGVRFDRLTPAGRRYLRAMAELGPGPHRSGDIARVLGRKVSSLGPIRQNVLEQGMIWSPSHGDTAFTVPLFDEFMKRIMPGDAWRTE